MRRFGFAGLAALAQGVAWAENARPFAAPDAVASAPAAGVASVGQMTLALLVVLAAVFAVAWGMRRLRAFGRRGGSIEVLAEVGLGTRERAVLVKVGATRLLLGVAPGRVNTLHVLGESEMLQPADTASPAEGGTTAGRAPTFMEILKRSLGR